MARGLKKGYTPTAAQLAQREKFKAMVQGKKKSVAPVINSPVNAGEKISGAEIAIVAVIFLGLAAWGVWYFTKDKK